LLLAQSATRAAGAPQAVPADGADRVRLLVIVSVDQLRRDRLDPELPGGLGRLAREGRVFREAVVDHAASETCPGHVVLATGRHPGRAGVPGNSTIDRETGRKVYCVEDLAEDAHVFGDPSGRSPRRIRVDALGDWLKAARPGSRVYSVSGKDRAAIAMGGQQPDGAFWYWKSSPPRFTTSHYYADAEPDWLAGWNERWRAELPDRWRPDPGLAEPGDRPDDYPAESDVLGRSGEKPLAEGDADELAERVYASPRLDEITLDLARELVDRMELGVADGRGSEGDPSGPDGTLDLLTVSLSATDTVGHLYGPESLESRDALRRTDAALGAFLDHLDERVGRDHYAVALSSDHGVLPLPEWLAETGRGTCPVAEGRVGLTWLGLRLLTSLHFEFSPWSWPRPWLHFAGSQATVDRDLARRHGVPVEEVAAYAEAWLERQPVIAEAWTPDEIENGTSETARLYRHSRDPERSGDLSLEIAEGCLITPRSTGTTHGTPHAYDREVPIAVLGPGIAAGSVGGTARTVDLAPTLADWLGIPVPEDLDGHPLPLR
jgi:predicted AlkP superfamily pyrophosphatase or phosphodiesterase